MAVLPLIVLPVTVSVLALELLMPPPRSAVLPLIVLLITVIVREEKLRMPPPLKPAVLPLLGPGFGGIANQAQRLIAPLTEYSLQNYFVIPSQ